jgi:hypothetical protein
MLPDERIEHIRDELYAFAEAIVVGHALHRRLGGEEQPANQLDDVLKHVPGEAHCTIAERAGIIEFEAGVSRDEAERAALDEWIKGER